MLSCSILLSNAKIVPDTLTFTQCPITINVHFSTQQASGNSSQSFGLLGVNALGQQSVSGYGALHLRQNPPSWNFRYAQECYMKFRLPPKKEYLKIQGELL